MNKIFNDDAISIMDRMIVNEHKGEEVKKSMQEFFDKIGYECKIK